jgi:hypothetical protein
MKRNGFSRLYTYTHRASGTNWGWQPVPDLDCGQEHGHKLILWENERMAKPLWGLPTYPQGLHASTLSHFLLFLFHQSPIKPWLWGPFLALWLTHLLQISCYQKDLSAFLQETRQVESQAVSSLWARGSLVHMVDSGNMWAFRGTCSKHLGCLVPLLLLQISVPTPLGPSMGISFEHQTLTNVYK